mgnify:CR=1 FL=1
MVSVLFYPFRTYHLNICYNYPNFLIFSYETNEFNAPTTKTKRIQSAEPENTRPFEDAHPSGDARSTGTPITRANESPIKARSVS